MRSCDALVARINDNLDFSKSEAGRMILGRHDFDLHTLIDETIQMFAEAGSAKGLISNDPPAEPGAFDRWPLKGA